MANSRKSEGRIPPKPDVEYPVSWTWAVQQIVTHAAHAALADLVERRHGKLTGWAWLKADNAIEDEIRPTSGNLKTKKEFWDLFLPYVASAVPSDGPSRYGLRQDRAEAKLYVWLRLFGEEE